MPGAESIGTDARKLRRRLDSRQQPSSNYRLATVTSVNDKTVDINLAGSAQDTEREVPVLGSYSNPQLEDLVVVLVSGPDMFVLDKIATSFEGSASITSGTYTGDGASPRTFDVGFTPSAVIVQSRNAPSDSSFMTIGWTLNQSRGVVAASEASSDNEMVLTDFFHCTSNGFEVNGGTYFNDSGQVYDYIAFP